MHLKIQSMLAKRWLPFALIGLACAVLWGRTLSFGFVWDDKFFIQSLRSIRSFSHIPEMFYSLEAQSSYPEGFKLFRPLRTLHYALLYFLAGEAEPQPWLFHLANIAWHGASAMLLYQACLGLFKFWEPPEDPQNLQPSPASIEVGRRCRATLITPGWREAAALLAALGFVTHPVMTEVVCWAKSLDDAMAATFTLAAMVALFRQPVEHPRVGWAVFWFVLAIYSKVSAVPFALVIYPIFRLAFGLAPREAFRKTLPFLIAALVFMVHRRLVIGQSSQTAPISGTYVQTLVDTAATASIYLRLVLGMPPFFIDYSFLPGGNSLMSPRLLAGAGLGLALSAGAWLCWRRPRHHFLALGILWFGLFMLPVSNLLPMMQYMAERFLYLPMAGVFMTLGVLQVRSTKPGLSLAAGAFLLIAWSGLAWDRAAIWSDEVTLFVTSSQQGKQIPRVEQNAVAAIFALPTMRKVFRLDEKTRKLTLVESAPAARRGAVEKTLAQARAWFPLDEQILSASGVFYAQGGEPAKALPFLAEACRVNPASADAWANLGVTDSSLGNAAAALDDFQRALTLNPAQLEALRETSALYWRMGNYERALAALQRLKQIEPNNTNHEYWIKQARERLSKPAP